MDAGAVNVVGINQTNEVLTMNLYAIVLGFNKLVDQVKVEPGKPFQLRDGAIINIHHELRVTNEVDGGVSCAEELKLGFDNNVYMTHIKYVENQLKCNHEAKKIKKDVTTYQEFENQYNKPVEYASVQEEGLAP